MWSQTILQSDVLDIVFENRNKDYGAYALRKNYANRLFTALFYTVIIIVMFCLLSHYSAKSYFKNAVAPFYDSIIVAPVSILPDVIKPKIKPAVKAASTHIAQSNGTPVITDKPTDTLVKIAAIDTKNLVAIDVVGAPKGTSNTNVDGAGLKDSVATKPFISSILNSADVMPEFPGGAEAFQKFMLRNIKNPDDINEGEKIIIKAKFVVNADGSISGITILQSGRNDLDAEVMRVLNKMPNWKPGIQNGKNVAVYFQLPVSFIGIDN